MTDLQMLLAPFPPDQIEWRVGATNKEKTKAMALAYIDARDAMDRFDAVCGIGGWQRRYPHVQGITICEIGIKVNEDWVWKSDGAGATDVEAEKGACSSAFKRAAACWGVGRYLYDIASPWVEIELYGRSYRIKQSEFTKLRNVLETHARRTAKSATAKPSQPAAAPPPAPRSAPTSQPPEPTPFDDGPPPYDAPPIGEPAAPGSATKPPVTDVYGTAKQKLTDATTLDTVNKLLELVKERNEQGVLTPEQYHELWTIGSARYTELDRHKPNILDAG